MNSNTMSSGEEVKKKLENGMEIKGKYNRTEQKAKRQSNTGDNV